MRPHHIVPIALALAVSLTACGFEDDASDPLSTSAPASSTSDPSSAGGPPSTTALSNTSEPTSASEPTSTGDPSGAWVLVDGPSDPIPGWDVTIEIDGDRIGGTAACNLYGGVVEIGDGTIAVGEISVNEMGCRDDVQQLEQAFLSALFAARTYTASGDQLDITTPQDVWTFDRLAPLPTAELADTTWVLDGYIDGDSVSNEPGMDDAFIELASDGTMVGATNCRTLSGAWTETGSEIVFTEFAAEGDCPDEASWNLDSRIVTVLGDGFSAEIDGGRLTVTSQGNEGLTFRSDG